MRRRDVRYARRPKHKYSTFPAELAQAETRDAEVDENDPSPREVCEFGLREDARDGRAVSRRRNERTSRGRVREIGRLGALDPLR